MPIRPGTTGSEASGRAWQSSASFGISDESSKHGLTVDICRCFYAACWHVSILTSMNE